MIARAWSRLPRGAARAGAWICLGLVAIALLAPVISTHDPAELGDPVADRYQPPSPSHWFGTDVLGRDIYSRVVHGAIVTLGIALASVVLSAMIGLLVGVVAAWRGGWVDALLMRFVDFMLAFPRLFLVLLLVAYVDPGPMWIIALLGLTGWMEVARVVRGQALQVRGSAFIEAARAIGLSDARILRTHVIPMLIGPLLAIATIRVAGAILAESLLSFLGLGVREPGVSWGVLIRSGRDMLMHAWWIALFPGLAIALTVVGFNLLGEGLRDAFTARPADRPTSSRSRRTA